MYDNKLFWMTWIHTLTKSIKNVGILHVVPSIYVTKVLYLNYVAMPNQNFSAWMLFIQSCMYADVVNMCMCACCECVFMCTLWMCVVVGVCVQAVVMFLQTQDSLNTWLTIWNFSSSNKNKTLHFISPASAVWETSPHARLTNRSFPLQAHHRQHSQRKL